MNISQLKTTNPSDFVFIVILRNFNHYNLKNGFNQGNKLAEDSNLAKKEVLSVTGMKDGLNS